MQALSTACKGVGKKKKPGTILHAATVTTLLPLSPRACNVKLTHLHSLYVMVGTVTVQARKHASITNLFDSTVALQFDTCAERYAMHSFVDCR